ncbi:MAG TPA: type II toxin-antitoxin system VapC family toxin [Thermoanaerobaculia bacterium]|jgi:predicted nucleic acid-binding protein
MAAKIVVDTSVLIKWIKSRDEDLIREARTLLDRIERTPLGVAVPALLLYEVGNILLTKTRLGTEELARAIDEISALPLVIADPRIGLLRRTARIGRELDLTFYDASFVALAEELDCTFVTADRKLYQAARRLPRVMHLSDFAA